jgi:hypothetical protein
LVERVEGTGLWSFLVCYIAPAVEDGVLMQLERYVAIRVGLSITEKPREGKVGFSACPKER